MDLYRVTKEEARRRGYKINGARYKALGVCRHGHVNPWRYFASGECCECNAARTLPWKRRFRNPVPARLDPLREG